MSELKAVHAFDVYEAYTKTGNDDAAQVYLKSEADKAIAELKARIAELEEELRWRKCSEEKPNEEQFVLAWLTEDGKRGFFLTSCFINGEFLIGEDPHGCKPTYWLPLPLAPKEEK